jgi:restriction system protein
MAQRTYDFRPPVWRPRAHLRTQTGALLLGSGVWVFLCAALVWQIIHSAFTWNTLLVIVMLLCMAWTAGMTVAWQRMIGRWRRSSQAKLWPALSLEQARSLSPSDFEGYVAYRLFTRQGYAVENLPSVKDGGIDLIVTDRAGRRAIVQCKRYRGTVGEATVRDLFGTMIHDGASMGFLVTTGNISAAARRWAEGKPLILIDGTRLVELANAEPAGSR